MALALGLPLNVLLILKLSCCESLEDLTPGHILLGVLGELTSINLWGEKTREASKNFCLAMASFILLLNTIFLSIIYSDPLKGVGQWYRLPDNSNNTNPPDKKCKLVKVSIFKMTNIIDKMADNITFIRLK